MKKRLCRLGERAVALFLAAALLVAPFAFLPAKAYGEDSLAVSSLTVNGTTVDRGGAVEFPLVNTERFSFAAGLSRAPASGETCQAVLMVTDPDGAILGCQKAVTSGTVNFGTLTLSKAGNYEVRVSIEGSASDTADFTLRIGRIDTVSPQVVSTTPANGASNVSADSLITVRLSEEVKSSTVDSSSVYLKDSKGAKVSGLTPQLKTSGGGWVIELNPGGSLRYGETYTLYVTNAIEDLAGNPLAQFAPASFTVQPDPAAPPVLESTSPAKNSSGVSVNTTITVRFDKALNTSTVNSGTVYLKNSAGSSVSCSVSAANTDGKGVITVKPSSSLSYSTQYTLFIDSGVTGQNGKSVTPTFFSFTTEAAQGVGITSRDPADGETGVRVDKSITFKFTGAVDSSTVNSTNIYLRKYGSSTNISAKVSYSSSTRTVTIDPDSDLSYDTRYVVYVTNKVKDANGNYLLSDSWSFYTASGSLVQITDRDPAPNEKDVPVDTKITFKFSRAVKSSTVDEDTVYLRKSGSSRDIPADVTYSSTSRTVTLTPEDDLDYDTEYVVYVTDGIKDLDGVSIGSSSWRFTTTDEEEVTIVSRSPASREKDVPVDTVITIKFSHALESSTVNDDNIYLERTDTGSLVPVRVSYSSSNRTVTITPQVKLEYGTEYTVYVKSRVKATSGAYVDTESWKFTTVASPVVVPPVVPGEIYVPISDRQPGAYAAGVPVNSLIKFKFTTAMNASTINSSSIYLMRADTNMRVPATVSYDPVSRTVTIKPAAFLSFNTDYYVSVGESVKDAQGRAVTGADWKFRTTAVGSPGSPVVKLNGAFVNFTDVLPYIKNGRTFLPYRTLAETLGAQVSWDQSLKKASIILNGNKVDLYIGKKTAYKNGKAIIMDVAPEIKDNRTMVPLRFAAEALGVKVGWDAGSYMVVLESGR